MSPDLRQFQPTTVAYAGAPEKRALSEVWEDAACRDSDPDLWFEPVAHGTGGREGTKARARRVAFAKSICRTCPIAMACLADGVAHGDKWSIRGGLTPAERVMGGAR